MDELERYLEEKAAAADELERTRMEERDALYTADHRNARMPRLPHDLDLDKQRVEGGGLLDPRTLMEDNERRMTASIKPPSTLEFLDETREPKYMEPTENERVRDAIRVGTKKSAPEYPRKLVFSAEEWELKKRDAEDRLRELGRRMTPGQMDLETRVIEGMRKKQAYLRNPRHPEVPSSLDGTLPKKVGTAIDPSAVFVVEPNVIEFHQFELGETYEMRLTIRNKSSLSRRLRILPPPSKHFSITELKYPSDHGLLAPGNAAWATVRFKPDSLADYEDFVTVITETSKFRVECSARRHPPCLTLDQTLDVGYVLVGNDVESRMPFKNVGGEGRFRLVDEADWPDHTTPLTLPNEGAMLARGERPDPEPVPCVNITPFRVGPGYMELNPLDVEQLRVGFAPPHPGTFTQQFRMVCDNSQVQTFTVTGKGTMLDVGLTTVDERGSIFGEMQRLDVRSAKDIYGVALTAACFTYLDTGQCSRRRDRFARESCLETMAGKARDPSGHRLLGSRLCRIHVSNRHRGMEGRSGSGHRSGYRYRRDAFGARRDFRIGRRIRGRRGFGRKALIGKSRRFRSTFRGSRLRGTGVVRSRSKGVVV